MPRCSRPSPLRSFHIFVLPITHTCSFQLLHLLAIPPSFSTDLFSFRDHFYFRRNHHVSPSNCPLSHNIVNILSLIILDCSFSVSTANLTFHPYTSFHHLSHLLFFDSPRRLRQRIFEFVARIPRRNGRPRGRNGTGVELGIGALVLNARTNQREWNFVVESAAPNEAKTEKTDVLYPVPEAFSPGDRWKGDVEKRG